MSGPERIADRAGLADAECIAEGAAVAIAKALAKLSGRYHPMNVRPFTLDDLTRMDAGWRVKFDFGSGLVTLDADRLSGPAHDLGEGLWCLDADKADVIRGLAHDEEFAPPRRTGGTWAPERHLSGGNEHSTMNHAQTGVSRWGR